MYRWGRALPVLLAALLVSAGESAKGALLDLTGDPGLVTDPAGDADITGVTNNDGTPSTSYNWSVDARGVSVVRVGGFMRFRGVADLLGGVTSQNIAFAFYVDIDQNVATGGRITGPGDLGVDYYIEVAPYGATRWRMNADLTIDFSSRIGGIPVTVYDNGLEAQVALGSLGRDDGRLNYVAVTYVVYNPDLSSGILDVAPDETQPRAATSFVPEPAAAGPVALAIAGLASRKRR